MNALVTTAAYDAFSRGYRFAQEGWRDTKHELPGMWLSEHELHALLQAQELDGSASTGTVYWEGLAELRLLHAELAQTLASGHLVLSQIAVESCSCLAQLSLLCRLRAQRQNALRPPLPP